MYDCLDCKCLPRPSFPHIYTHGSDCTRHQGGGWMASGDTLILAEYDFDDSGSSDDEGWTSVDLSGLEYGDFTGLFSSMDVVMEDQL